VVGVDPQVRVVGRVPGTHKVLSSVSPETGAVELIEVTTTEVLRRGEGMALIFIRWAQAVHDNLGRYEDGFATAQQAGEHPPEMGMSTQGVLVELIEAGTRSGMPERAADALLMGYRIDLGPRAVCGPDDRSYEDLTVRRRVASGPARHPAHPALGPHTAGVAPSCGSGDSGARYGTSAISDGDTWVT
jgi:hypothetical protein